MEEQQQQLDVTAKLGSCLLPGDVMVEILLCLPVNSLLQFRAVSKSWYVFINSPDFNQMHLRHPRHEKLLRVSDRGPRDTPTISFFSLDHPAVEFIDDQVGAYNADDNDGNFSAVIDLPFPSSPDDEVRVVASCNGLLCVHFNRSSSIVLWNPATRKYKFLDLPDSVSFYCDPFFPYVMFGYVPEMDDYNVVKFPLSRKDVRGSDARVWIYSLSLDSWEEMGGPVLHVLFPKGGSSVTFNGSLYWMSCNDNGLDFVTSFDLYKQVFGEIKVPDSDIIDLTVRKLVVLKGCLSMIIFSECGVDINCYEVWVMTKQGVPESWTKKFDILPFSKLARPVGSWKDSELLFGYPNGLSHELLSYNPYTKRMQSFQRRCSVGRFKVVNYVESLESVECS